MFEGWSAVVGSWVIGGKSAGIGVREDRSPITSNHSSFVPHLIEPGTENRETNKLVDIRPSFK